MIKINNKDIYINSFPDGTILLKDDYFPVYADIIWHFENDRELLAIIYLVEHLRSNGGTKNINLIMPYIPNARQDRTKNAEDVFTLKYFANIINSLHFDNVIVFDPHSYVSEALINNVCVDYPNRYIESAMDDIQKNDSKPDLLFFPDEGAMKRYANMFHMPFAFGIKQRDWATGKITALQIQCESSGIKNSNILIIDDICSRGGTFYHSARKLKSLGANNIYLYVSHCENTILDGELLDDDLITRVYTTDSIFTKTHRKIEVMHYVH